MHAVNLVDHGRVGTTYMLRKGLTSSGFNKLGEAVQQENKAHAKAEVRSGWCENIGANPGLPGRAFPTVAHARREMIMNRVCKKVKTDPI